MSPSSFAARASVLVVDDNRDAAESLQLLFEAYGYEARCEFDGQSGLNAALAHPPDFVVLDLALPHIDGCALVRLLRNTPGFEYLPIVALSGFADPEHRECARDAGFSRYFHKPVGFNSLHAYFMSFR